MMTKHVKIEVPASSLQHRLRSKHNGQQIDSFSFFASGSLIEMPAEALPNGTLATEQVDIG